MTLAGRPAGGAVWPLGLGRRAVQAGPGTPLPTRTHLQPCPLARALLGGRGRQEAWVFLLSHAPCSRRRWGPRSSWPRRTSSSGRRSARSRTLRGVGVRSTWDKRRRRDPRHSQQGGRASGRLRWVPASFARGCLTLDEVRVVGLVGREHRRHLVVVRRVDVFVNAVPGQLYL